MKIQNMEQGREGWRPSRQEVDDFLREQTLCTIASLDADGHPQVATVAFSVTEDHKLIIGTNESSRKAGNIARDPHVAVVVTDEDQRYTVQLEGTAQILSPEEFEPYSDEHYNQLPASRPFKDQPGEVNILVGPTHLRFSDCDVHPWQKTEYDY
ncbi:MAG TPA: pyridoxamine 5'-phosphate oxidase family protein [Candidatus Saccharimonadales bacterium]|nr:pyridoxamine 5'-phosphate oxidase family protein [Candidatus Saccharimonadales bacterium]